VVYKHQFSAVGVGFIERGKLSRLRSKCPILSAGRAQAQGDQCGDENDARLHSVTTLLLSPNRSVSTPIRWAMSRSRLLMCASAFTGRLQIW